MPAGVLANIQTHQEQAEGSHPVQAIAQRAGGNHRQATGLQRGIAERQGLPELLVILQNQRAGGQLFMQCRMRPGTRSPQTLTQLAQYLTIGLCARASLGQQFGAGLVHG